MSAAQSQAQGAQAALAALRPPARLLVTRRNSAVINGLEAGEHRADLVSLARPS